MNLNVSSPLRFEPTSDSCCFHSSGLKRKLPNSPIHILLCSNFNEMSCRPCGQWLIRLMINHKQPCNQFSNVSSFMFQRAQLECVCFTLKETLCIHISIRDLYFAQTCDPTCTDNMTVFLHVKGCSVGQIIPRT